MKTRKRSHASERQLVLQHLENVSWRLLSEYPDLVRKMIRRRSGIYALYRRNKLYYVGLASNLMGRLNGHLRDRHHGLWDRFSVYLTVRDEHIKELESLVLRIVHPSGNKQTGKFARSQGLLQALDRLMRDADADRRARLLGGYVAERRTRIKTAKGKGARVLAGIWDRSTPLRGWHKGRILRATVRTDGRIHFAKTFYDTPSAAAAVAVGHTCNGWSFWHHRNEKGEWVPLKAFKR